MVPQSSWLWLLVVRNRCEHSNVEPELSRALCSHCYWSSKDYFCWKSMSWGFQNLSKGSYFTSCFVNLNYYSLMYRLDRIGLILMDKIKWEKGIPLLSFCFHIISQNWNLGYFNMDHYLSFCLCYEANRIFYDNHVTIFSYRYPCWTLTKFFHLVEKKCCCKNNQIFLIIKHVHK